MGQYYSIVIIALWLMGAVVEGGQGGMLQPAACSPPLFVLGASYMDVGENAAAMPFRENSDRAPYGLDYFDGKPTGRYSNGRLIIDHICDGKARWVTRVLPGDGAEVTTATAQGLGQDFLSPYLRDVGSSFRHGVNFASAGSTACNSSFVGDGSDSTGLFSLSVQVDQFRVFHQRALAMHQSKIDTARRFPAPEDFSRGVYIIETGGNDYYKLQIGYQVNEALISSVLESIENAIRTLYLEGARTIVVMDAFPAGCFPMLMWESSGPDELSEDGCWIPAMKVNERHNERLRVMLPNLTMKLPGANLIIFSLFDVFMNAIRNPSKLGLKYVHKACCGFGGGDYNYDGVVHCSTEVIVDGQLRKATVCENRSEYMMWDGLHPTDAFTFHIAEAFIDGKHMQPPFHIKEFCWQQLSDKTVL